MRTFFEISWQGLSHMSVLGSILSKTFSGFSQEGEARKETNTNRGRDCLLSREKLLRVFTWTFSQANFTIYIFGLNLYANSVHIYSLMVIQGTIETYSTQNAFQAIFCFSLLSIQNS